MAVLAYFPFSTGFTGITTVATVGTVTIVNNSVQFDANGGSGNFGHNGCYQTTLRDFYPGHVIYGQIEMDSFGSGVNDDFLFMLTSNVGIGFGGMIALRLVFNVAGTSAVIEGYDDTAGSNFGTPFDVAASTWYDFKYEFINGGASDQKIKISIRLSSAKGVLDPTVGAWTVIGTSTSTLTPGLFRMAVNVKDFASGNPIYHMTDWIWTDNGSITSSILDSSDFSSSTGWTLTAGGTGSATIASGHAILVGDGTNHSNLLRTLPTWLDLSHIITWDAVYNDTQEILTWLRTNFSNSVGSGLEGYGLWFFPVSAVDSIAGTDSPTFSGSTARVTTDNTIISNVDPVIYNCKAICQNSGVLNFYTKKSTDISFTLICHSTGSITGSVLFFHATNWQANNNYIDNFVWDDGLSVPPPAIPTGLMATAASQSEIDLAFTDNGSSTNETGIKIERSLTSGSGFSQIATVAQGVTTYSDTGLSSSTTYYYKLRSYITIAGVDYNSAYTSESNATTSASPITFTSAQGLLVLGEL